MILIPSFHFGELALNEVLGMVGGARPL